MKADRIFLMTKRLIRSVLPFVLLLAFLRDAGAEPVIRISFFAQKNFGKSKAGKPQVLTFIADRIAEEAVLGVCVVDELQDSGGQGIKKLRDAVGHSAGTEIFLKLSDQVGEGSKEQFGFFWNPNLVDLLEIHTAYFDGIERDPGVATFKAKEGFDFTLCPFHTPPDSRKADLIRELQTLDHVFRSIQEADPSENDIILLGDFNAPPFPRAGQSVAMEPNMLASALGVVFLIQDQTTNVIRTKLFDNMILDPHQTTELIDGSSHVVQIDAVQDYFHGHTTVADPQDWLRANVIDHCPIYADFRADLDTD